MPSLPTYNEDHSSQIPATTLLTRLGYSYLMPAEALALRGSSPRQVVLTDVLADWLRTHNAFQHKHETHSFNESAIQEALRRITDVPLESGLVRTNERIYELLTLGFSFPQTVNGDTCSHSLQYIDWQQPENNVYHVTEEFTVERERSHKTRRPDLVCFVNGIPLVVIECKRPDLHKGGGLPHEEAIAQQLRNQRDDEIPTLFIYSQLLLALSTNQAAYGTTATEKRFWTRWQDEEHDNQEARLHTLLAEPIPAELQQRLSDWRRKAEPHWQAPDFSAARLPTVQDHAILSLLEPPRLLELCYQFILFDKGIKKIARYQQYYAVKATIDRVAQLNARGERTGGVIWHTTGSGKSLTMVMLAKALSLHPAVRNPHLVLVTDRINLDRQIYRTFGHCGKQIVQAKSGKHLMELVRSRSADIIATVIDKFERVADVKVSDDNPNIFVLVDESHRGQYGLIHSKMRRVFPHACYIGFTGTPLLKKEKNTAAKFGGFIHKYTMRQAVDDGTVMPLLYEGRMVELNPHQDQLDRWFERHTAGLTDDQKADLKRKMSSADVLHDAERRIQEIAYNLSQHFSDNIKGHGFKAQLATSSKQAALRYRKYIRECGLLTCEVVISAPDTREDHEDILPSSLPEVQQFWREMMQRFGSEESYNRELVADFASADGIDLLIVVDKLLVGFDEPRNTVLYLDKNLKNHAILQAIARVNRLFDGKDFGYVIDYRGILGELNEAIDTYDALAEFDPEDIEDTIVDVSEEIAKLPQRHSDLWALFNGIDTSKTETLERYLQPEDRRQQFYDLLSAFARSFKVALGSVSFYENTPTERIQTYKSDLKKFHNLRNAIKLRYAETVDFRDYEKKIRTLLDAHIDATGINQLTAEVNIFDKEAFDQALETLGSPRARAEAILNHLKRTAIEKMETDPAFYRRFSQMISETLQAIYDGRMSELDALHTAQELHEQEISGSRSDLPVELTRHVDAPAYYGVIDETLPQGRIMKDKLVTAAIEIENVIESHKVVDWQSNSSAQNDMKRDIDDFFYRLEPNMGLSVAEMDALLEQLVDVARKRS